MRKYFIILVASIMLWTAYFLASVANQSISFDSQMFLYIAIASSLLIANVGRNNQSDAMKTLFVLQSFTNTISVVYVNLGIRSYEIDIAFGVICATIALFSMIFKMKINRVDSST